MRLLKIALALLVVLVLGWSSPDIKTHQADATDVLPPCTVSLTGSVATITCSGIKVGTVQVPVIHVTSPPLPPVTQIVKVPPVKIPRPTKTVTKYIKQPAPPMATVTKTVRPSPSVAPSPTAGPTPRQTPTKHATIGPATPLSPPKSGGIDFGDHRTTVKEASIGLLATLALMVLLIGMWYTGYTFGFREADSKNAKFIKEVLGE